MRRLQKVIGFLAVAGMFAESALYAGGAVDPADQREFFRELPAKPELAVELISADCVVGTGSEDRIRVRVIHSYAEDRYQVDIQERGGEIRLRERFLQGSVRGSSIWYLTVPDTTRLLFSSANGDFDSSGDYAMLEVRTATGRISVRNLTGTVEINTASGAVWLRDLVGELSVTTAIGEVEVDGFSGRLNLRTAAGEVELSGLDAEVEAATVAGDIDASELRPAGECSFSSAAGDIEVGLAAPAAFDLTLASASGFVELDLGGHEVAGTFVFSALQHAGRIESPFDFDNQEIFVHEGKTYFRKTFSRGSILPRITLSTAAGTVRLKP